MGFGEIEGAGYELIDREGAASLLIPHARIERVWSGARWSEGPVWVPAHRYLVWSDIPNDRMLRLDEQSGDVSVFRQPSGNSNGNTLDAQGRLVTCEHLGRRVTRTEHDGSITVLAESYRGKRLNSPNDVIVRRDGSIWFTDPMYGILSSYEGVAAPSELGRCHVFKVDPTSGSVEVMADDFMQPNGLAFSPDERVLYVSDTGGTHVTGGAATHPPL